MWAPHDGLCGHVVSTSGVGRTWTIVPGHCERELLWPLSAQVFVACLFAPSMVRMQLSWQVLAAFSSAVLLGQVPHPQVAELRTSVVSIWTLAASGVRAHRRRRWA